MYALITILIIIICVLLGAIVLIQNPKGGGVNASFSGASQQIFGASRSTDVVERTTWTLAILLLVFSVSSAFFIDRNGKVKAAKTEVEKTEVEKRLNETGGFNANFGQPKQTAPAAPAQPAAPASTPEAPKK
jgi:preprotein translocase subunit SecG